VTTDDDERMLTVKDIAERLQMNEETIRRWLRTGELRGMQMGERSGYRVPVSELRRFIASRMSPPREAGQREAVAA